MRAHASASTQISSISCERVGEAMSFGAAYIPGVSGVRPPSRAPIARVSDDERLPSTFVDVMREGLRLLDDGYPWEAHECFEVLWHACGREGPRAAVTQALAKVGAALVKERQGSGVGRESHARGALSLIDDVLEQGNVIACAVDVTRLRELCARLVAGERPESFTTLLDDDRSRI
jgi:hypothetical protein